MKFVWFLSGAWIFNSKTQDAHDLFMKLYTEDAQANWSLDIHSQLPHILHITQQLADSNDLPINPD